MIRFKQILVSGTALALAATPQIAAAEQADDTKAPHVEELVVHAALSRYSVTKSDTPIEDTARSISIESMEQIIDKGALDLADTYTYSAGVFGNTYGLATRGDWLKIRGLDVPEFRDSLQALFGNYNNTRSDIYTLEQVEILKGPAAVLYGQGSPGGLVNVVSKLPKDSFAGEIVAEVGNHNRQVIAGDITGPIDEDGQFLYRIVAKVRDAGTQVDYVNDDAIVVAPSLTWRPTPDTNITVLGVYQENDGQAAAQFLPISGTLLPGPNGDYLSSDTFTGEPGFDRYDTTTTSVTLLADHRFSEVVSAELTVRYTDGNADYNQAWPSFIGGTRYVAADGTVARTFYVSDAMSEQLAADFRIKADFNTGALSHRVLIGTDFQDVKTDNDYRYGFAVPGYYLNLYDPVYGNIPTLAEMGPLIDGVKTKNKQYGITVHDQISYENWLLTIGLRSDWLRSGTVLATQKDDVISTSVALMYQFDAGFSPYVSYAESFEPIVGTMFDGSTYDPQRGKQIEVGVKYQPPGTQALFTAAYFDIEQSNLLTADPTHPGFNIQEGDVDIKGFEFEGLTPIGQDFSLEANYSLVDTETTAGFRLASVPKHQASAWLGYRPQLVLPGFKAGLGIRYVGSSWDGADALKTPSYTVGDLMVGFETGRWDFAINVRNLTDKKYQATCLARGDCFPGKRRTIVGRLAAKF